MLPPHFRSVNDHFIKDALNILMPHQEEFLPMVAEMALASVVYHKNWITNNLESQHPIFNTILFRQTTLINDLYRRLQTDLWTEDSLIKPTGKIR